MKQAVLEVKGLTKYFGDVAANKDISLSLDKHEILAIVGENGAGKSTFCKMLTGIYHPDKGSIAVEGEEVRFQTPADSISRGISMVYQERNLVGMLTGAQNICLGHEPCRSGLIDGKGLNSLAEQIKHDLGLNVDLNTPVEQMGAGEQQLIEIMRALRTNPKILILDEPTAGLDPETHREILDMVCRIREKRGTTVILVTHNMDDAARLCDRILVMDQGRLLRCGTPREVFSEPGLLKSVGLGLPEAAELLDLMRESGVSVGEGVLFAREAADAIERYFQRDTGKKDAKLQDGSGLTARADADTPRVFIRPMSSEASPPEDKQRREEEKC